MTDRTPTCPARTPSRRARRGLSHVGACVLLSWLVLGCRSRREELYSRPPPVRGIANAGLPTTARTSSNSEALEPSSAGLRGPEDRVIPAQQPAPEEQRADAGARDFSAELAKLFGDPISCLAPRTEVGAPAALVIGLRVQVMPSGAVAHEEVSGAGLSAGELGCLRRRLESVRFGGAIVNAPFAVSSSVTLSRKDNPSAPVAVKNPSQPAAPAEPDQAPPPMNIPTEAVQTSPEPMHVPTEAVQQSPEPMLVPTEPVPQP